MKNIFKVLTLLAFTQISASSHLVKIDKSAHFASQVLGKVELYHHDGNFIVKHNNKSHPVEIHNIMSPELRNIKLESLSALLNVGKIHIKQNDKKEFVLRSHVHGKGGGPILGWIAWALVKVPGEFIIHFTTSLNPAVDERQMRNGLDYCANVVHAVGDHIPGKI